MASLLPSSALLVRTDRGASALEKYSPGMPIGWIAVPTKNRPDSALRCARAVSDQYSTRPEIPKLLVCDDSDLGRRVRLRSGLEALAKRSPMQIFHVAANEKATLAEELRRLSGVDGRTVHFALFGDEGAASYGANQNSIQLLTKGNQIAALDDDVVPTAARHESIRDDAVEGDPFASVCYVPAPSPEALNAKLTNLKLSVFDEMEAALHRTEPGSGYLPDVVAPGLFGDSGTGTTVNVLLTRNGNARELTALSSGPELALLLGSRWAASHSATVAAGPMRGFMTAAYALENRGPTAPFFPLLRGTDALFGLTLAALYPAARFTSLPFAVEHAPSESRESPGAIIPWRVAEFLTILLRRFDHAHEPVFHAHKTIERLAAYLAAYGNIDIDSFSEVTRDCYVFHINDWAVQLLRVAEDIHMSDAVRAECYALISNLESRARSLRDVVPSDLDFIDPNAPPLEALRDRVRNWAELVAAWPLLEAAAPRLENLERFRL